MTHNEKLSQAFTKTIKTFAEHPERLENFESYLDNHFSVWFEKYANTPEGLIYEMQTFSEMN